MKIVPLVSIVTLAYNHGKYIRQCLEGFVMQITDFPFEVIIHDDASTDYTAEIIREITINSIKAAILIFVLWDNFLYITKLMTFPTSITATMAPRYPILR